MSINKIALAVSSFSGGGAERVIVNLANKFSEMGYFVDLLVFSSKGPYRAHLNKNVTVVALTRRDRAKPINIFIALYRLWRYLNSTSSDVLLTTIRQVNVVVTLVRLLSPQCTLPLVLREADTLDRTLTATIKNRILLALMRFTYKRSSLVVANSNSTKNDLCKFLKLHESRVSVIYNPLDIDYIKHHAAEPLPIDVPTIVCCGRLDTKKNFKDAIKALPLIRASIPNARLLILGEGRERESLRELAAHLNLSKSVIFTGFVDNPYSYLAASHVFVQTSLWEGFGNVLAEAMACGTPVVSYDSKGAMREITSDGVYGTLVPTGDIDELANAAISAISAPPPNEVLLEGANRFNIDTIATNYINCLNAAFSQKRPPCVYT